MSRFRPARWLRGRWRLQTLVGLLLLPASLVPLYLYLTETETGQLMTLRARYSIDVPSTPHLDPGESSLARSSRGVPVRGVPVLVYHGIGEGEAAEEVGEQFVVSREHFADHMRGLRAAGFSPITVDALADYLDTGDASGLPERPIVITFDDGRTDALLQADPIFEDTGMRATMFVIADQESRPGYFHADWDALTEYAASGRWELESHTNALHERRSERGHLLSALVDRRATESLGEYRERVAADLDAAAAALDDHGAGRLSAFAYPYGDWGRDVDPAVAQALREVLEERFDVAFDQDLQKRWRPALRGDDPMRVHRLQVGDWSLPELLRQLDLGARRSARVFRERGLDRTYSDQELVRATRGAGCGQAGGRRPSQGSERKEVTLIVSGAPSPTTHALLDVLDRAGAHATFFVTGNQVEPYGPLLRRMVAEGHAIGNGLFVHEDVTGLSTDEIRGGIRRTTALVEEITGTSPCALLSPFGTSSRELVTAARQEGLDVVSWTLDPYEGRWTDAAGSIARAVAREAGPGSVVLLADTAGAAGRATLEALPPILERLERMGYVTVTL